MKKIYSLVAVVLLLVGIGCSSDDNSGGGSTDNFDRAAMLTNWADNIIIPAYQNFSTELGDLNTAITNFVATPNTANLTAARTEWLNAYKAWQYVEMFNIGKAEELSYNFYMNVYPLNETDVENNIANGNYDLNSVNNQDAQGFSSIDYLLYGVAATDADILDKYTIDANANGYKTYLTDVLNQMQTLTSQVVTNWTSGYRDSFVASSGNTSTSAVNKLVNDFIFYYEKTFRANKIGIPAGVFSATPLPGNVEAFYKKDVSRELALIAYQAIQDFFIGKHFNSGITGESMRSYLDYLNTIKDGTDLSTLITNQFNSAEAKINLLNVNFVDQINTDNTKMTEAYDEIQKAVVLLKVDMLQAFNISVDFVDADGD